LFNNLRLNTKLNLLLALMFSLIVLVVGSLLAQILETNAIQNITDRASLLMETMLAVREYTSEQVNPELAPRLETEDEFLPQTVPGYAAQEVFENLRTRESYRDFFYKEATLNPTNLRNKADLFERQIIEKFRANPEKMQTQDFRQLPSEKFFYVARPIRVSKESCLRCHSDPALAPRSQILTYGDRNGFGWELNEIVGAQIISVPVSRIFESTRRLQLSVIGSITVFLIGAGIVINIFLRKTITKPLRNMSQWAKQVSRANTTEEFVHKPNDEIGILAASVNRMKVSLEIAISMLNSQLDLLKQLRKNQENLS